MTFDIYKGSFDLPNANKSSLVENSKASLDQIRKEHSRSRSPEIEGEKELESLDQDKVPDAKYDKPVDS